MKPVLQAIVLAEHVYEDTTGKKIIAGTFNVIKLLAKPPVKEVKSADGTKETYIAGGMQGGSPFAYVCLTDVCDNTTLLLQFVDLTRNRVLLSQERTLPKVVRLSTVELVLALPMLPITVPGNYAFEVLCEGAILGSCRITAEELNL